MSRSFIYSLLITNSSNKSLKSKWRMKEKYIRLFGIGKYLLKFNPYIQWSVQSGAFSTYYCNIYYNHTKYFIYKICIIFTAPQYCTYKSYLAKILY